MLLISQTDYHYRGGSEIKKLGKELIEYSSELSAIRKLFQTFFPQNKTIMTEVVENIITSENSIKFS